MKKLILKLKLKSIAVFLLTIAIIPLTTAIAEQNNGFPAEQFPYTELSIQVMPEFTIPEGWTADQPAVLIGYHGKITNQTGHTYSGPIELSIPTQEQKFTVGYLAQYIDQGKELIELQAEINQEKGIIKWKPAKPIEKGQSYEFIIEYYYALNKNADLTIFTYSYIAEAKIEKANIVIYQPIGAGEFKIRPITDYRTTNNYGIPVYIYQYTNLAIDQKKLFEVSYLKQGNLTTLDYIHGMQTGVNPHAENQNDAVINSTRPLISDSSAYAISIAIVASVILLFFALRKNDNKKSNKKDQIDAEEEIKHIRRLYAEEKIDQQTYSKRLNQLNERRG